MTFPTNPNMTADEFHREMIEPYWTDLRKAIKDSALTAKSKDDLPKDYAEIGSFLSNKMRVEKALVPLEQEIRNNLVRVPLPEDYGAVEPYILQRNKGGSAAHLKSHKLLTNALRKAEAEAGFNHEQIQNGTFFDQAIMEGKYHGTAAKSDQKGNLTAVGKEKATDTLSKKEGLARGAPTVLGDLDPLAFNVLLRHGYQFKDVAAGAYHGEYTHRLQWYAIIQATATKDLTLHNPPLDIFRSLGYLCAKADKVPSGDAQLWMWQALFDTAETEADAKRLKTLAWALNGQVFTCPENFNKSLMSVGSDDSINTNNLWCLRVLLKTRWKKRFDETLPPLDPSNVKPVGLEKLHDQLEKGKPTMVISSHVKKVQQETLEKAAAQSSTQKRVFNPFTQEWEVKKVPDQGTLVKKVTTVDKQVSTLRDAGYALVWYLRNDKVL
jgi:hypothetical protein